MSWLSPIYLVMTVALTAHCLDIFTCSISLQAISAADMIIVMDKGNLKWSGTSSNFLMSPYMTTSASEASKNPSPQLLAEKNSWIVCEEMKSDNQITSGYMSVSKEGQDATDVEARKEGRVEFSVYK